MLHDDEFMAFVFEPAVFFKGSEALDLVHAAVIVT